MQLGPNSSLVGKGCLLQSCCCLSVSVPTRKHPGILCVLKPPVEGPLETLPAVYVYSQLGSVLGVQVLGLWQKCEAWLMRCERRQGGKGLLRGCSICRGGASPCSDIRSCNGFPFFFHSTFAECKGSGSKPRGRAEMWCPPPSPPNRNLLFEGGKSSPDQKRFPPVRRVNQKHAGRLEQSAVIQAIRLVCLAPTIKSLSKRGRGGEVCCSGFAFRIRQPPLCSLGGEISVSQGCEQLWGSPCLCSPSLISGGREAPGGNFRKRSIFFFCVKGFVSKEPVLPEREGRKTPKQR